MKKLNMNMNESLLSIIWTWSDSGPRSGLSSSKLSGPVKTSTLVVIIHMDSILQFSSIHFTEKELH